MPSRGMGAKPSISTGSGGGGRGGSGGGRPGGGSRPNMKQNQELMQATKLTVKKAVLFSPV